MIIPTFLKRIIFIPISFIVCSSVHAELLYVPKNFQPSVGRFVVVLHGCLQNAEVMAYGTGWNKKAAENNFAVLYPQSPRGSNALGCWNWFLRENQRADSGQLKELHKLIVETKKKLGLSQGAQVFLAGISSGAATVSGLLACFPQDFAAAAIHSGPSYGLAKNIHEAEKVLKEGPESVPENSSPPCDIKKSKTSVLVLQGSTDEVVHPSHAQKVIQDFLGHQDVLKVADRETNGLKYKVTDFQPKNLIRGRIVLIEGLAHAWSGISLNQDYPQFIGPGKKFSMEIPFFSHQGPSATDLSWDFFQGK